MEKLTLEHIAPYLPYKMIGKSLGGRMYYLDTFSNMRGEGIENREIGTFLNEQFKPILRPMDLTKPIIVEGKEVIPIMELAKIGLGHELFDSGDKNDGYRFYEEKDIYDNYSIMYSRDYECCLKIHCSDLYYTLGYNTESKYFFAYMGVEGVNEWPKTLRLQLSLFQWLFKHKFDVFNLIPQNLAIDVNTLTTNPYN